MSLPEREELATAAAIWALPYVLFGRYLDLGRAAGATINQFIQEDRLSGPRTGVRGANVDTLYGHAWLDLTDGPLFLALPDAGERYYSIQFVDSFQSMIGYLGNHTSGLDTREAVIVGPTWTGPLPEGTPRLVSPTNWMLACARTRVDGSADAADARAVHSQFRIGRLADGPGGLRPPVMEDDATSRFPYIDFRAEGAAFFDDLCQLLTRIDVPAQERPALERFAVLGIAPGAKPSGDPELRRVLDAATEPAVLAVERAASTKLTRQGSWFWSDSAWRTVPETDPLLRAAVNHQGPALHVAAEAILTSAALDTDGAFFDGSASYRLTFPATGLPPVAEFWSVTLYAMPDMALVANPIDRYAIGSNIDGMEYEEDGALRVIVQHEQPEDGAGNWLPAPESGTFILLCRMYRPVGALLTRGYELPSVERVPR